MMTLKISRYIFVLLLSSLTVPLAGQVAGAEDNRPAEKQEKGGVRYASREEAAAALRKKTSPLLAGVSVSFDVAGAVMAAVSPYGQMEAACRLNLRNRFFPIVETGIGLSDHTDESTELHYKTKAPYFRVGCDYNLARDVTSGNRIFAGLRYAFTSYKYDLEGPPIVDPVWDTSMPFSFKDVSAGAQWAEVVFGLEAKVWSFFHLGWSFRYRLRLHEKTPVTGNAWYVPGYGKSDGHALGRTLCLICDI